MITRDSAEKHMVSYDLLPFMLKIETSTRGTNYHAIPRFPGRGRVGGNPFAFYIGIMVKHCISCLIFIFFSARKRAEFNKSGNLIGSWSGGNSLIRTVTAGGIHRVDLFS